LTGAKCRVSDLATVSVGHLDRQGESLMRGVAIVVGFSADCEVA